MFGVGSGVHTACPGCNVYLIRLVRDLWGLLTQLMEPLVNLLNGNAKLPQYLGGDSLLLLKKRIKDMP